MDADRQGRIDVGAAPPIDGIGVLGVDQPRLPMDDVEDADRADEPAAGAQVLAILGDHEVVARSIGAARGGEGGEGSERGGGRCDERVQAREGRLGHGGQRARRDPLARGGGLFEVDRRLMDRGLDEEPARARELPLKQMLGPHKTQRWAKSIYFQRAPRQRKLAGLYPLKFVIGREWKSCIKCGHETF